MLSNVYHRQHRSLLQTSKITDMLKQSTSGTLSPETTTTTSSGYSTGGSSVSTNINPSLKKSSLSSIACKQHHHHHHQQKQQQQQKTKSKGLHNLFAKLKNLLLPPPKPKTMRSTTSRQISSTNVLRQYRPHSPIYDVLPSSSLTTNNKLSLPFTYYYNSPIRQSRSNFDKISAWLNHTEKLKKNEQDSNDLLFIDTSQQLSTSSSAVDIDNQGITVIMKRNPINIKPPKRSSSLVTRITRPVIEQQSQKTISPSSSFSSSILTKGMSERMTPSSPLQKSDNRSSKPNRRRTVEFSRRRTPTTTSINEHKSNKENFPIKNQEKSYQDVYQFPSSSSNNKTEIHIPSTKHFVSKTYYFHSNPIKTNEDLLNNSYGLTLLSQEPRHSSATALMISQVPNQSSSQKHLKPRISTQQKHTLDSLDDLLCDREVESYFYPTSSQSENVYMNLENPSSLSYIHGTLC